VPAQLRTIRIHFARSAVTASSNNAPRLLYSWHSRIHRTSVHSALRLYWASPACIKFHLQEKALSLTQWTLRPDQPPDLVVPHKADWNGILDTELQREFDGNQTLYQIHQSQVAQYDPIAITRFTSQFVGLWYWLAYLGFPLVVSVILIWIWYQLTRD
jgi:hypothetical protein